MREIVTSELREIKPPPDENMWLVDGLVHVVDIISQNATGSRCYYAVCGKTKFVKPWLLQYGNNRNYGFELVKDVPTCIKCLTGTRKSVEDLL